VKGLKTSTFLHPSVLPFILNFLDDGLFIAKPNLLSQGYSEWWWERRTNPHVCMRTIHSIDSKSFPIPMTWSSCSLKRGKWTQEEIGVKDFLSYFLSSVGRVLLEPKFTNGFLIFSFPSFTSISDFNFPHDHPPQAAPEAME